MGKGDGRRVENSKLIDANWDKTFGKGKVDQYGPTWTDTTPPLKPKCDCHKYEHQVCDICQGVTGNERDTPTMKRPTCRGSYRLGSACGRCERCKRERDDDGREIDDGGEIIISDYDEHRAMHRDAKIARHLKLVLPLIYAQMERELESGCWPS